MLLDKVIAELLKKLGVPLDDRLLLLTSLPLYLLILFLEPMENVLEFITFRQNLDDGTQEATIDVLHEALAVDVGNLFGVLQAEDGRYNVWELLPVHAFE